MGTHRWAIDRWPLVDARKSRLPSRKNGDLEDDQRHCRSQDDRQRAGRDTVDQVAGDYGTPKTASESEERKQQEADLGGFGDQ